MTSKEELRSKINKHKDKLTKGRKHFVTLSPEQTNHILEGYFHAIVHDSLSFSVSPDAVSCNNCCLTHFVGIVQN